MRRKAGKARLDHYYHLAKQHGFRARSAFKLMQINKEHGLLKKSVSVALDLCAAPGGWLQVLQRALPPASTIVGVDLEGIRSLPGVATIRGDITSAECVSEIARVLDGKKADLVLNDGSPNVGTAWDTDAFRQNELVLASMRIACEFLAEGGAFLTKVFRSRDYNSLLWVATKLFSDVRATKPKSSRQESAELFFVCRGYRAPESVDPKFFDPKCVFAEAGGACAHRPMNSSIPLSVLLAAEEDPSLDDYYSIAVDCLHEEIDEELLFLFADLKQVGAHELKT